MELAIGALVLLLVGAAWSVGRRRERVADRELRELLRALEGERVTGEVVVGALPATRGVQLVATVQAVIRSAPAGARLQVDDVRVEEAAGQDPDALAARLERDGLEVDDLVALTGPDGVRHDLRPVRSVRRRDRDAGG
ncbi:hypothetical protein FTX61_10170 [Nitriliruptoraceae bacterium ZYF776]|nr:hypothetical protein [Profundirhabdus halotolerans]